MCYILFYPFTFPKYKFEFVFLPFTLRIYVANIMLHRRFQFVAFRTQFLLYGGDHFAQLSVYSIYCKYNKFEFVFLPFTLRIYVANIMLHRRFQFVAFRTQFLLYGGDHFAQLSVYSIYCKYNKFEFVLLPFTLRIYVANIMLNRRLQSVHQDPIFTL